MCKTTLTVLAGILLITLAAVPASAAGTETAVQSVDSIRASVVLALAAGHSIIINTSHSDGVAMPNAQTSPPPCRAKAGFYADGVPTTRAVHRLRNSKC